MKTSNLTPREMMEIHELLNFKTLCAAKFKAMGGLVTDTELKALMDEDVQQSIQALNDLQSLIAGSQGQ